MNTYAVLISTGIAHSFSYDEFWNDTVCVWNNLRNPSSNNGQGIDDNNIFVLYGTDGTDFKDEEGRMTKYSVKRDKRTLDIEGLQKRDRETLTDYAASRENIEKVFEWLASKDDVGMVFVWTFGHGFRDGSESYLVMNDGSRYTDTEFTSKINTLKCDTRIICMQQCFSGGFIDNLMRDKRNIVLTSCSDSGFAYPADNDFDPKDVELDKDQNGVIYNHGEFNHHLCNALSNTEILNLSKIEFGNHDGFCDAMMNVFNYVSSSNTVEEATQYFDIKYGWCAGKKLKEDCVRSVWSFGCDTNNENPDERDDLIEFSYPMTELYNEEQDKKIYLSINGKLKHIFKMERGKDKYRVRLNKQGKFGLEGWFIADYYHRLIYFKGTIIGKEEKPYCIGHVPKSAYYHQMDPANGRECSIIVFNWV